MADVPAEIKTAPSGYEWTGMKQLDPGDMYAAPAAGEKNFWMAATWTGHRTEGFYPTIRKIKPPEVAVMVPRDKVEQAAKSPDGTVVPWWAEACRAALAKEEAD